MNRVDDKIQEIEKLLEELESILPIDFEEYLNSLKIKAAGERYLEKIIATIVDLAFLIIKEKKLKIPEEEKEAFDTLAVSNIISQELCERLKDAKGMRNIIAHEYGKVNDELVFYSLKEELIKDSQDFIKQISKIK